MFLFWSKTQLWSSAPIITFTQHDFCKYQNRLNFPTTWFCLELSDKRSTDLYNKLTSLFFSALNQIHFFFWFGQPALDLTYFGGRRAVISWPLRSHLSRLAEVSFSLRKLKMDDSGRQNAVEMWQRQKEIYYRETFNGLGDLFSALVNPGSYNRKWA